MSADNLSAAFAREKCNREIEPNEVALMGIYHDANEIITGDMPTPVKYYDNDIQEAYRRVENVASHTLINKLPKKRPALNIFHTCHHGKK